MSDGTQAGTGLPPALSDTDAGSGFEKVILHLVKDGPERIAVEAGQIDAIVDLSTGNTILLPEAQQALIKRQGRFRSLVGLSTDWYWHQDEQHRFVSYASAAGKNSGAWNEDIIGKTLWDLAGSHPGETDWRTHRQQLEWRAAFRDVEVNRIDATGAVRSLCISGEPVFDEQEQFKGYQGITRDITERKLAETANRHASATLDALAAQVAVLDANGVILLANKAWRVSAAARAGTTADVMEGSNYLDACAAAVGDERADAIAIAAGIRQVIAGESEFFRHDQTCASPAGPRRFTLSVTADAGDSAVRAVISREDITERKQA